MQPGKLVHRSKKYWLTLLSLCIFVFTALFLTLFQPAVEPVRAAQSPNIITYQGKLLSGGLAASTTQSMIISLYTAISGGSIVYTASGTLGAPAALSVSPTSGIFTVNLGDTGTNSIDPSVFQSNQNLYLQLTIGGETLTPRKPITAAPYAFNSKYLDGVAATSTPSSSTYIPISSAAGNFDFNRITSTGIYASGTLTATGLVTLATTTISSSTITTANITSLIMSGGTFGNVTSTNLALTGLTNLAATTITNVTSTNLYISSLSNFGGALTYATANGTSITSTNVFASLLQFTSLNGSNATSTNLTVTGFVNLGNVTSTNLNVSGITNLAGTTIASVTSTNLNVSGLTNLASATSTNLNVSGLTNLAGTIITNVTTTNLFANGLVGIGTTISSSTLTVRGTVGKNPLTIVSSTNQALLHIDQNGVMFLNTSTMLSGASGPVLFVARKGADGQAIVNDASLPIQISTDNTGSNSEAYYAVNSGEAGTYGALFGYAQNNPTFGDAVVFRSIPSNATMQFIVNNATQAIVIAANGNVAIGTSTPKQLLSVTGGTLLVENEPGTNSSTLNGTNFNFGRVAGYNDGVLAVNSTGDVSASGSLRVYASSTLATTTINNRLSIQTSSREFALNIGGDGSIIAVGTSSSAIMNNSLSGDVLTTSGDGVRMIWYARKAAFRAGVVTNDQWNESNIGLGSAAFGFNAVAKGDVSFAVGSNVTSSQQSFVFGRSSVSGGDVNFVTGDNVFATGSAAFAGGQSVSTTGNYGFAYGLDVGVKASNAFALGQQLQAQGANSFALGQNLDVTGIGTFGINVTSTQNYVVSQNNTIALLGGNVGVGLVNPSSTLQVQGSFRVSATSTFMANVGIGTTNPITQFQVKGQTRGLIKSIPTLYKPANAFVQGKYLYVTQSSSAPATLSVFDISTTTPALVGNTTTNHIDMPTDLVVQGNYAFVSQNASFISIFDISSSSPSLVSKISTGSSVDTVVVKGKYLYALLLAGSEALNVYDISKITAPVQVASVSVSPEPFDLAVNGNFAYVIATNSLQIFNITNPASPVQVAAGSAGQNPHSIAIQGNLAYVTDQASDVLRIIDVSNPARPIVRATYTFPGGASANPSEVVVSGQYAYVLADGSTLYTLDVSVLSSPPVLVSTSIAGDADLSGLVVNGRYAYILGRASNLINVHDLGGAYIQQLEVGGIESGYLALTNGLSAMDGSFIGGLNVAQSLLVGGDFGVAGTSTFNGRSAFTTGTASSPSITFIGDTETGLWSSGVDTLNFSINGVERMRLDSNGYLGVGTTSPQQKLHIADGTLLIDSPVNPSIVGTHASTGSMYSIYVSGKYAYGGGDFTIWDITRPTTPVVVNSSASIGGGWDVKVVGKYAYIAQGSSGLQIVDISDPSRALAIVGSITGIDARGVDVSGSYAYVADFNGYLRIYDISNPASPLFVKAVSGGFGSPRDVQVNGRYAYVADSSLGFFVVDISEPLNAVVTDSSGTMFAFETHVVGKYAYVAGGSDVGFRIFDVSNPADITIVATVDTDGTAIGMFVAGKYAYLSDYNTGIKIFDISNPASPFLVSTLDTEAAWKMYISGKFAYLADEAGDLKIIDIKGADISSAAIGNLAVNDISITGIVDIADGLRVRNDIRVGNGGIFSDGSLTVSATSTTSTIAGNIILANGANRHVSIGTSTVASSYVPLFIAAGFGEGVMTFGNPGFSNAAAISLASSTMTTGNFNMMSNYYNADLILNRASGANIFFREENGGNQFTIGSAGNVGVNTTTPVGMLSVQANATTNSLYIASTTPIFVISANGYVSVNSSSPAAQFSIKSRSNQDTIFDVASSSGSTFFRITSGGQIGINSTTPQATFGLKAYGGQNPFEIASTSNALLFRVLTSGAAGAWSMSVGQGFITTTPPTNGLIVQGNVGIGTNSPSTTLHVVNPVSGGTLIGTSTSTAPMYDVRVQNSIAYVVTNTQLVAIDVTNPRVTREIGRYSPPDTHGSGFNMSVVGRFAYVFGFTNNVNIVDISNPSAMTKAGTYVGSSVANSLLVVGSYLYAAVNSNGLIKLDVSNPLITPTAVSTYSTTTIKSVDVQGRYAYTAEQGSFAVVDVSTSTMFVVGRTPLTNTNAQKDVKCSGSMCYVADNTAGLVVIDVRDPANPTVVATLDTGTPESIDLAGRYAYLGNTNDLLMVDVSSSTNPRTVATTSVGTGINGIQIVGKLAYLATDSGLKIYDLGGIEAATADIYSLQTYALTVQEDAYFGSNAYIGSSLNVGAQGITSNGPIVGWLPTSTPGLAAFVAAGTFITNGSSTPIAVDKRNTDGIIMSIRQDGTEEGTISVGANTVSYNAFTGSHYATLPVGAGGMTGSLMTLTGINGRYHDKADSEILYGVSTTVVANDSRVLGAYLSLQSPGFTADTNNPHLIMAVGNGEMWVSDNGYDIEPGDYLISASVAGHAMKDLGDFDQSYIVGRAAESVEWSSITSTIDGVKHVKISVFFDSFVKDNRLTKAFTIDTGSTTVMLGTASTSFGLKLSQSLDLIGGTSAINFTNAGLLVSNLAGQTGARSFVMNAANFAPASDVSLLTLQAGGVSQFVVRGNGDVFTNGIIKADSFMTGTSTLDLAEIYPIKPGCEADNSCPEAGDAVCLVDNQVATIEKCSFPYSEKSVGIISTDPGFTLGGAGKANERKVALAGRVPLKVSTKNGAIKVGDKLTSSDIAGVAMKATENGPTIGVALQDYYGDTGSVLAFVKMGWWAPLAVSAPVTQTTSTFSAEAIMNVVIAGLKNLGLTIAQGVVKAGEFIADKITSGEVTTQKLCVDETCITQTQFKQLLEKNNIAPEANAPTSTPTPTPTTTEPMPTTPDPTPTSTPTSTDPGTTTPTSTPPTDPPPVEPPPTEPPPVTPPAESPVTPPTEPPPTTPPPETTPPPPVEPPPTELPPVTPPAEPPPATPPPAEPPPASP